MIKIGDRVLINTLNLKKVQGVVEDVYQAGDLKAVYVVKTKTEKVKCLMDDLTLIEDEVEPDPDVVTINREDFKNIALSIVDPVELTKRSKDKAVVLALSLIGIELFETLEAKLFGELE